MAYCVEFLESRVLLSGVQEGQMVPSSSISAANYKGGYLDSGGISSASMQGMQTITVTATDNNHLVTGALGGISIGCSDALSNVTVDGAPETASSGLPSVYQYYVNPGDPAQPIPDAGYQVSLPGGTHTVTFTIDPLAPSQQQTAGAIDSSGNPESYQGAWVVIATGGFFGTGISAFPFDIVGNPSDIQVAVTSSRPRSKPVFPGERIDYTVTWVPAVQPQSASLEDILPVGTSYIPHSADFNADVEGNTITWANAPASVTFAVKVGTKAELQGLSSISDAATVTANYSDGRTLTGSGTAINQIGSATQIEGIIHNADMNFPRALTVNTARPLSGVTVLLKDSDGNTVDSAITDATGHFKVDPGQPGTYQLEIKTTVDSYDPNQNKIISAATAGYAPGQEIDILQSITVAADQTKPQDLGTLYLPVGFASNAAKVFYALNNIYLPKDVLLHGALSLPDLFQYNTTNAQQALTNAEIGPSASGAMPLNIKDLHAGGSPDAWISAMRMIASLSVIDSRMNDMLGLADAVGRTVSFLASQLMVKSFGKWVSANLKGVKLPTALAEFLGDGSLSQKIVQRDRVVAFTVGVGQIIPHLLDALGVSASQKQSFLNIFANCLRYGSDMLTNTGKFLDDASFEVVINLCRAATDAALMVELFGATIRPILPAPFDQLINIINNIESGLNSISAGGLQTEIDTIVTLGSSASSYSTSTDTIQVLGQLSQYDDEQKSRAATFQQGADIINNMAHFLRGLEGIYKLNEAIVLSGSVSGAGLGATAASFQTVLSKAGAASLGRISIYGILLSMASATFGMFDQSLNIGNVLPSVPFGPAATSASAQVVQSPQFSAQLFQSTGPALPAATSSQSAAPAALSGDAASSTSASPSDAYLADLAELQKLIAKNDMNGVNALLPTIETDDNALFASGIVPLAEQAVAVSSNLSTSQQVAVANFSNLTDTAVTQVMFLYSELGTWEGDGLPSRGTLGSQITTTIQAIKQAVAAEPDVQAALSGQTVPAIIDIDDSAIPQTLSAGQASTFQVTVTNNGGQTSAAGTIAFSNDDGSLVLQNGAATQTLPALAPGQATIVSWQVMSVNTTGTLPQAAGYGIITNVNGQLGTDLGEVLMPPT